MSWITPRGVSALVAVVALTLLAGCGGSDDLADDGSSSSASASTSGDAESPSASPSESSSTPTESASDSADLQAAEIAAVEADYRQYMAAFVTAYRARDAKLAKLIEYSTASRQAKHRSDVATMRRVGWRLKGTPKLSVQRVVIEGNRATMRVCEYDRSAYYVDANGNSPVAVKDRWLADNVQLIKRDGHWKVNKDEDAKFSCKGAS
jgi:hypothetical protein